MNDEELDAVIAHECGHILCRHVLYHSLAEYVLRGVDSLGLLGKLALITYFVAWPVLLTQIWGMVKQADLDDQALSLAESVVTSSPVSKSVQPTSVASFCSNCGAKCDVGMKFCPHCGVRL